MSVKTEKRNSKKTTVFTPMIKTRVGKVGKLIAYSNELTKPSQLYQRVGAKLTRAPFYPSNLHYNLTISEENRFVWFRVAKVGSRTILDIFKQANVKLSISVHD